jgi:hypothetical protein
LRRRRITFPKCSSITASNSATLWDGDAEIGQKIDKRHKGETDEAVRIPSLDFFEQDDAHAFAFEASGTVEGLLYFEITPNLLGAKGSEVDSGGFNGMKRLATFGVRHGDRCVKRYAFSSAGLQLLDRVFTVSGFAHRLMVDACNLIGADDVAFRYLLGDRP